MKTGDGVIVCGARLLVSWNDVCVSDQMMSERNIKCLTANQVELVEHLCCKGVLTAMVAADFMNLRVKEQIESAGTDQEINERFVQWLRKAPEGAYHQFLKTLKKTQVSSG